MQKELATQKETLATTLEQVVISGDLAKLSPGERLTYYNQVCHSLGVNPLTKPFAYIVLNGKLTLYATRDCADQLRKLHKISIEITSRGLEGEIYAVTVRASTPDGRTDESMGAVAVAKLAGESLANALMKSETKAKRRATLSICGLGWIDETEVSSIPDAQPARVDLETGEVIDDIARPISDEQMEAAKEREPQPSTQKQIAKLMAITKTCGADGMKKILGIESFNDLTKQEASKAIDAIEMQGFRQWLMDRTRVAAEKQNIPHADISTWIQARTDARTSLVKDLSLAEMIDLAMDVSSGFNTVGQTEAAEEVSKNGD